MFVIHLYATLTLRHFIFISIENLFEKIREPIKTL